MKLKNSRWYQKSDSYFKAEFDVQVLIGAADLRFQTLDQHGLLSQDYTTVDVNWYSPPTTSQNPGPDIHELSADSVHARLRTDTRNESRPSFRAGERLSGSLSK